jgi:hypothetical protein
MREVLAARAQAEEAPQETGQLRTQLEEVHEATRAAEQAVRTMMLVSPRNLSHDDAGMGTRNMTFTINPKRQPVFKGERDMQIVGDFINDLQRQFEARCYEIGWLTTNDTRTPGGSGIATPTTVTMMSEGTPRTDGWTRYALLQLKETAGRWATSKYPNCEPYATWDNFCRSLKEEFTPLDALRNFEDKWQRLTIMPKGHVVTFNEQFRRLRLQLDPHSQMTQQL